MKSFVRELSLWWAEDEGVKQLAFSIGAFKWQYPGWHRFTGRREGGTCLTSQRKVSIKTPSLTHPLSHLGHTGTDDRSGIWKNRQSLSPNREFSKAALQKSRKENKSRTLTSQGQTPEESYLRKKGKALLRGPGGKEVVGRTCSSPQGPQPQMWAALMSSPGSSVCPSPRLTMSVFWKLRQWGSHFLIISFRIQDLKERRRGWWCRSGGRKRTKHAQDLGFWPSTAHHPVKERRFWASQITRGFK